MANVKDHTKLNVWIPDEQLAALRQTSDQTGIPMATIVRRALERELAKMAPLVEASEALKA